MTIEATSGRDAGGPAHAVDDVRARRERLAGDAAADRPAYARPPSAEAFADGVSADDGRVLTEGATPGDRHGFVRRYRLPLALAFVALCLYAGSILYILYGRGQIA